MLLNTSKCKLGSPVHIVSINLLLNYTWTFSKLGGSQIGFLAAYNNRMRYQHEASEEELMPWHVWRRAVKVFWTEVLDLPLEQLLQYENCGPRPEALCMDGVAIGMMVDNLKGEQALCPYQFSKYS